MRHPVNTEPGGLESRAISFAALVFSTSTAMSAAHPASSSADAKTLQHRRVENSVSFFILTTDLKSVVASLTRLPLQGL